MLGRTTCLLTTHSLDPSARSSPSSQQSLHRRHHRHRLQRAPLPNRLLTSSGEDRLGESARSPRRAHTRSGRPTPVLQWPADGWIEPPPAGHPLGERIEQTLAPIDPAGTAYHVCKTLPVCWSSSTTAADQRVIALG